MADTDVEVTWSDAEQNSFTKKVTVTDGEARKPLIVLLHGNGGNANDMAQPDVAPGMNYDFTRPFPGNRTIGWRWYPGVGVWSFELDPDKEVEGWQPFLRRHGFRTVNYAQIDETGFLERPTLELAALIEGIVKEFGDAKLVFIAHSRGGLLTRKYLKDHAQDKVLDGRVTAVITLHSPHLGSELANVTTAVASSIASLRSAFGAIVDAALGSVEARVGQDSYQELRVGGSFLADLENGEKAFPGAAYHTFGGTSALLTRIRSWIYTVSSAIPQWHLPPYRHRIAMIEVPVASPVVNSLPDLTPEFTEGLGDILVADARAHLSCASQRTNGLNHAEALWDGNLKNQVLTILGEEPAVWA
ncbi:MAG: hypothetical protein AUI15_16370 [Actinobacteria bacterium 13_2_20CM_2_66_6]|nr:MAG: hypothetical protein AUI15_16370 [Actinobacteria bacterium 13_2_20CM_2_66_6]